MWFVDPRPPRCGHNNIPLSRYVIFLNQWKKIIIINNNTFLCKKHYISSGTFVIFGISCSLAISQSKFLRRSTKQHSSFHIRGLRLQKLWLCLRVIPQYHTSWQPYFGEWHFFQLCFTLAFFRRNFVVTCNSGDNKLGDILVIYVKNALFMGVSPLTFVWRVKYSISEFIWCRQKWVHPSLFVSLYLIIMKELKMGT